MDNIQLDLNQPMDLSGNTTGNNMAGMEVTDASAQPQSIPPVQPEPAVVPPASEPAPVTATPTSNISTNPDMSIEDKLEAAREAMEGPEHTAKREMEEKKAAAEAKIAELDKKVAALNTQKEKYELAWVELDTQRNEIKGKLQPILEAETQTEAEEEKAELEEKSSMVMAEKEQIEKRRQEIQAKRKDLEQQKWQWQDKLAVLEEKIAKNTKEYQGLIEQEDVIKQEIDSLKPDLV